MSALRPGYKQTEVGVIPEEWGVEPLSTLLRSRQLGGNYANTDELSSWPLIKMGNMGRGSIRLDKVEYVPSDLSVHDRDRLEHGDVLLNTRNTLDLVGKVCVWRNELPEAYFNSNILRISPNTEKIASPFFLNYMLNSTSSIERIRSLAIGTTSVAAIYGRDLNGLEIPVPPLPEQQAIAEALGDADALIEALEALIAKKRAIKQGAMQDLLTGHRRLPGFQGEWVEKKLGTCVAIRNEKVPTLGNPVARTCVELEQILPAVGQVDRFEDAAGRNAIKYRFYPDDVLFGRLRPYLRKYWLATVDGVCSTEIWPLVAQGGQVAQSFLFHVVQTEQFIEAASAAYGTHMPRADWKMIADSKLRLPPILDEQRAIAAVLSDMDAEIAALEDKLAKARDVKQGMMQVLLTGEIRLV
ncbi:MAG: restriction endonuclease subunit S [Hyphomicrobiaceae bacterium]|nr:restriction endonuclease subunit S [Hyphomicrobiaceae bacterium]